VISISGVVLLLRCRILSFSMKLEMFVFWLLTAVLNTTRFVAYVVEEPVSRLSRGITQSPVKVELSIQWERAFI